MFDSFKEVEDFIKAEKIQMVNYMITDLNGYLRQVSLPAHRVEESLFVDGIGIGMASYPGFSTIESSDMKVILDLSRAFVDPLAETRTLCFFCNIYNTDGKPFGRDPRGIVLKAENYVKSNCSVKDMMVLPELEFYVFDHVSYVTEMQRSSYCVDAVEATWNSEDDKSKNLGHKIPRMGGQECTPPRDHLFEMRCAMVRAMEACGVAVKYHHHEAGNAGQCEIELLFDSLAKTADNIQIAKYVIKNVATAYGKTVTFMPKPLFNECGNGLHFHMYFTDGEGSLFYDPNAYAGLSKMAEQFIGGLLKHTPALMAIVNPSTNSYKRFSPGLAAPVNLFYSLANRTAAIRIPGYGMNPRNQRIEYRMADTIANSYLCLASIAMAGADGILQSVSPQAEGFGPFDVNAYSLSKEELAHLKTAPTSFEQALKAITEDNQFLTRGGVFDEEFVKTWVDMKLTQEVYPLAARPHPYEFSLYFDR